MQEHLAQRKKEKRQRFLRSIEALGGGDRKKWTSVIPVKIVGGLAGNPVLFTDSVRSNAEDMNYNVARDRRRVLLKYPGREVKVSAR